MRSIALALAGACGLAAAAPAAAAGAAAISVSPDAARAGSLVRVSGSVAGGCAPGDGVTLISRAFSHRHDFAGLPAVYALPRADGRFAVSVRIPAARAAGAYAITGRCGGGNLGVTARLRVLARPGPSGGLARREVVLRPSGARLVLVLSTSVLDSARNGRLALNLSLSRLVGGRELLVRRLRIAEGFKLSSRLLGVRIFNANDEANVTVRWLVTPSDGVLTLNFVAGANYLRSAG
jgi:hypothetical protein